MFYVTMTDRFMSGWGQASGLTAKYVIECETESQAKCIEAAARERSEMRHVNIRATKPYYGKGYQCSMRNIIDVGGCWYDRMPKEMRDDLEKRKEKLREARDASEVA